MEEELLEENCLMLIDKMFEQ